jgi:hypothetical protein
VIGASLWPLFLSIEKEVEMPKLRMGHAPGHVRDTACAAFEAWLLWDGKSPEPTVEYEIQYEPHQIPISRACGLVWNCTDIVPGNLSDRIAMESTPPFESEPAIKTRTYSACARFILEDIKKQRARAA